MKIGILLSSSLTNNHLTILNPILKDKNFSIKLAIIDNKPKRKIADKIKINLKRGVGFYIFIMFLKSIFSKKSKAINAEKFCLENNIDSINTTNIYSDNTVRYINNYNLDVLLLINGYGIIKKKILQLVPLGILSYHHGDMRKYRGMPPGFWELYNNEKEMGVTVQRLSAGLDKGSPIVEKDIIIYPNDTYSKLRNKIYSYSHNMMYEALIKISNSKYKFEDISNTGKLYTLPNLRKYIILNFRVICRKIIFCFNKNKLNRYE